MRNLWLAAILGVALGIALTSASYSTTPSVATPFVAQQSMRTTLIPDQAGETSRETQSSYLLPLISFLIGSVVALPVFLVAKKRL